MAAAIRGGLAYFALVFAIGFALGAIRITYVIPRFGELPAVLLELPVMLASAWLICGWLVTRCRVPDRLAPRLAMGATAFAVLMLAELALAMLLFGRTPAQHLDSYRSVAALFGLAGQLLFAGFPLWCRRG
jgi:hypothetical protein